MKAVYLSIVLGVAGGVFGYMAGKYQTEQDIEMLLVWGEATSLMSSVQVLSAIRKGQFQQATEWLEHSVDTNLITLSPHKEVALAEKDVVVLSSLKLASLYRELYKNEYKAFESESADVARTIEESLGFGEKYGEYTHKYFIDKYLSPNQSLNQNAP
ncbi:MAG: hypothetical protein V3U75_01030 [Methylococcaceae bacterium]